MDIFTSLTLRELPFFSFNKVAIVVINLLTLVLLFVVFKFNKFKDRKSRIFGLMGIFMLFWVDFAFLARLFGFYKGISLKLLKVAWVATPLLFYCTYLISVNITNMQAKLRKINVFLLILTLFFALLTGFSDFTIQGITFRSGYLDIIYGKGFYLFLGFILILMFSTIFPVARGTFTKSSKSFIIGIIIFYLANSIFNIVLPVFFKITYLYWIGDYSTLFLLGFTTYSIVKYKFFDIKIVLTEALTVIILIILLSRIFIAPTLGDRIVDTLIFLATIILGIFLVRSVLMEIEQRKELEELSKRLKVLDAQKNEFIFMAAHEFRAPLTAIKGYISMILEGDTGDISEKAREFLIDVSNINDRLIRLVNNMLNVSKIEEGRMVYQMEVESLSRLAQAVFNQFRPEAKRKGLEYQLNIPPELKDMVEVDPDRIQEVMGNFLSNAIKYTDKGSVVVRLSQPTPETVRFEVTDTGPGISKEEQTKLFQKFYRVRTNVGKTTGTGLGLYISRLLIEKFNGKIGVESTLGVGSTFWFELPLSKRG